MKGLKDITNSYRSLKETSDDYVRFTFKRVTEEDVGTYCIMAKNMYGCDRAFFTVRLRYRARSATPTGEGTTYRRLTYQEKYGYRGKLQNVLVGASTKISRSDLNAPALINTF